MAHSAVCSAALTPTHKRSSNNHSDVSRTKSAAQNLGSNSGHGRNLDSDQRKLHKPRSTRFSRPVRCRPSNFDRLATLDQRRRPTPPQNPSPLITDQTRHKNRRTFGHAPQQWFPNSVIQASLAPTANDSPDIRIAGRARFSGPIPVMIDAANAHRRSSHRRLNQVLHTIT
jgi:hypothetical protein